MHSSWHFVHMRHRSFFVHFRLLRHLVSVPLPSSLIRKIILQHQPHRQAICRSVFSHPGCIDKENERGIFLFPLFHWQFVLLIQRKTSSGSRSQMIIRAGAGVSLLLTGGGPVVTGKISRLLSGDQKVHIKLIPSFKSQTANRELHVIGRRRRHPYHQDQILPRRQ
jgi:hypothetical protein